MGVSRVASRALFVFYFLFLGHFSTKTFAQTIPTIETSLPSVNSTDAMSTIVLIPTMKTDIEASTYKPPTITTVSVTNTSKIITVTKRMYASTKRPRIRTPEPIVEPEDEYVNQEDANLDPDDVIIKKWKNLVAESGKTMESMLRQVLPQAIRLTSKATLTTNCQASFLKMVLGIRDLRDWAVRMIDASGKIPSGITRGTMTDLGDFDLCLSIMVNNDRSGKLDFQGQYCNLLITPQTPKEKILDFNNFTDPKSVYGFFKDKVHFMDSMKVRIGMCIPSSCTNDDIKNVIIAATDGYPFDIDVPNCYVKEPLEFKWEQILVICVFVFLALVLLVGTGIDLYMPPKKQANAFFSGLKHFSLYTNGKRLLQTEVKTKRLKALNGIKVMAIMWILVAHTYSHAVRFSMMRVLNFLEFLKEPAFAVIWNGFVSVDVFFVLAGFLLSYLTLMYLEKTNGRLNVAGFYLRRFWRLLPSVLFIMAFMFLFPLMGSGPLWDEIVQREVDICKKNWWSVIFFVNSWLDYYDMCLVHTWFISNDIHFYVISPIYLVLIYKRPTLGIIACLATILGSIIALASLTSIYDLTVIAPSTLKEGLKFKQLLELNYFKPYAHLSPYFIGFLLGYFFFKHNEIKLKKVYVILGWCCSTVLALLSLISVYKWSSVKPTIVEAVAYQSLHRVSWGLAIAWIIFACCYGYGGWLNTFLSWRGFVPVNRLVYMIYLTQMPIQWLRLASMKHLVPFDHIEVIYEFFANIIVTVAVSAVAYLAVEAPFASLDTAFFGTLTNRTRKLSKRMSIVLHGKLTSVGVNTSPLAEKHTEPVFPLPTLDENKESNALEEGKPAGRKIPPMLRQRTRSSNDITGKFSAALVSTWAPETEPTTEIENRESKIEELKILYKEMKEMNPNSTFL